MLNAKSFLTLDCGAFNLKLGEFGISEAGGLTLVQYGLKTLGQEGTQEATREAAMQRVLQETLSERSYGSRNVNLCAPGFHTFSKFVKLPPVDTSKVTQIIQYEAQQNVPFPLEEVVWDYQILGATPTGELEVLLVAIKSDVVEGLFRAAEAASLRLQLVDVSPAALCNAFRYNYADLQGCTLLLDIGAKTSNLLFFDKGNHYSRGINIGANAITQEFAKEAKLPLPEAERIKIEQGFVSLGGAYEEPDSPHQAAISKIARQVMTRLHIQVNQTVQFYRSQQGGAAPERLFLSGGGSIMPYTAQFFSEKLNVPVEYFNPFRNVHIDPSVNLEELSKVAHSMGEVVGLGLRNLAHCPVELNLMPKSVLQRQQFHQKKPYFVAAVFCLILVILAWGLFYRNAAAEKETALARVRQMAQPLAGNETPLKEANRQLKLAQLELDQYAAWLEDRLYWGNLCTKLRESLLAVETKMEKELNAKTGVWVEGFFPQTPPGYLTSAPQRGGGGPGGAEGGALAAATPARGGSRAGLASRAGDETNEIATVLLRCRGVNLISVAPAANTKIAYAVAEGLRAQTNYFETNRTDLVGEIRQEDSALTFTFDVILQLMRPFVL